MKSLVKKQLFTLLSIAFLLVITFSSCKKFLDLKPENALTRDNYFKSKDDAQSAIIGCYDGLQACVSQFLNWGEFRADLVQTGSTSDVTYPYFQSMDKTKPVSDWSSIYMMIGRANTVIQFVPRIPQYDASFSVDDSKKILAEAYFLRALGYFYLVRTFKEVPLVLQAPADDNVNYFLPKSPADTVLNQIEADLAISEASIPESYAKNADTRGRATLGAVHALQTDVYLWRAKYQQAVDAGNKVLNANSSLYSLVRGDNWFSIFSQKNTTESIMEVQFDNALSENNNLKTTIGYFSMNSILKAYFDGATDTYRGLNNTYVNGNGWWKYSGLTTTTNIVRPTNDPNYILYRLPDVMLMMAEAYIHLGTSQNNVAAIKLIDSIHVRAGLAPYDVNRGGYLDGNAPYSLMIELVMQERAMELAAEGKRWFDLVRVATNDNNPDFLIIKILQSRSVGDRSLIKSRIIDPRSWYMPILQTELNNNPRLVQNPFYK